MAVSLLWVVVAPVYAHGLALLGRALMPVLEAVPDTRYVVQGGRLLASRTIWLPKQKRMAQFNMPLWDPATHCGVPLLAALILRRQSGDGAGGRLPSAWGCSRSRRSRWSWS